MIPMIIHAIPIEIEPIDKTETQIDPDTREPYRTVARKDKLYLEGQIRYDREDRADWGKGGRADSTGGHLVFLKSYIDDLNIKFSVGDKIVKVGGIDKELYVTGTRHGAHYPDEGGPTLYLIDFEDRSEKT